MSRTAASRAALALCLVVLGSHPMAQGPVRHLTTIPSMREFPGYFHLQNVQLRGEISGSADRLFLRGGDDEIRVILGSNVRTLSGAVDVRGQLIDVGRLEAGDVRVAGISGAWDTERWPHPGEVLLLNVSGLTSADPATRATVRALALEPWKFEGQTVMVVGQFRGRNLLGDLPASPAESRYDFVLRSAGGAVWVTGLRPRGRGFDLAVDARVDTGRWVEVTGTVSFQHGLAVIAGSAISLADAPTDTDAEEVTAPPPPVRLEPLEVVFSAPTTAEINVPTDALVRVQFSRGANPATLEGRVRVSYLGAEPGSPGPAFDQSYDGGTRALELRFTQPLERLRTVKVELLDGIEAFDGAPFAPWSLTFSTGE